MNKQTLSDQIRNAPKLTRKRGQATLPGNKVTDCYFLYQGDRDTGLIAHKVGGFWAIAFNGGLYVALYTPKLADAVTIAGWMNTLTQGWANLDTKKFVWGEGGKALREAASYLRQFYPDTRFA